jgi:HD-GYP domain-containing protein (c-di-GMP phosphodiesterase class II)
MTNTDAERRLQLLIKFAGMISNEPRLDTLLELIADQVREIVAADRCTVFLIDLQTNELWSKIAQGIEHQEIRVPMGKGISGLTAVTGETINIKDAYSDNRFTIDIDKVTGYKTRNVLAVPLKNNKGEILGVFEVLNKKESEGAEFTEDDIGLLQLLGTVASNALENAKLYENIRRTQLETIYRLAITAEYRDQQDTARHLQNISSISYLIAVAMGLPTEDAEDIRQASALHDIGKVGLCDAILLKPGKLTPEEYEEMKKHTVYGAKILANAESRLLRIAYRLTSSHHEKFDGSGYPNKLKGKEIPLEARIVSVADVFDALCMPRVYKPAWGPDRAYDYILAEIGKSFDPEVVEAFKSTFPEIKRFYENQRKQMQQEQK